MLPCERVETRKCDGILERIPDCGTVGAEESEMCEASREVV